MTGIDLLIVIVIAAAVAAAVVTIRNQKKKGRCCGCSGCSETGKDKCSACGK